MLWSVQSRQLAEKISAAAAAENFGWGRRRQSAAEGSSSGYARVVTVNGCRCWRTMTTVVQWTGGALALSCMRWCVVGSRSTTATLKSSLNSFSWKTSAFHAHSPRMPRRFSRVFSSKIPSRGLCFFLTLLVSWSHSRPTCTLFRFVKWTCFFSIVSPIFLTILVILKIVSNRNITTQLLVHILSRRISPSKHSKVLIFMGVIKRINTWFRCNTDSNNSTVAARHPCTAVVWVWM